MNKRPKFSITKSSRIYSEFNIRKKKSFFNNFHSWSYLAIFIILCQIHFFSLCKPNTLRKNKIIRNHFSINQIKLIKACGQKQIQSNRFKFLRKMAKQCGYRISICKIIRFLIISNKLNNFNWRLPTTNKRKSYSLFRRWQRSQNRMSTNRSWRWQTSLSLIPQTKNGSRLLLLLSNTCLPSGPYY